MILGFQKMPPGLSTDWLWFLLEVPGQPLLCPDTCQMFYIHPLI